MAVWPQDAEAAAGAAARRSEEEKRRRLHWLDYGVWPRRGRSFRGLIKLNLNINIIININIDLYLAVMALLAKFVRHVARGGHNKRSCPVMAMRLYRRRSATAQSCLGLLSIADWTGITYIWWEWRGGITAAKQSRRVSIDKHGLNQARKDVEEKRETEAEEACEEASE